MKHSLKINALKETSTILAIIVITLLFGLWSEDKMLSYFLMFHFLTINFINFKLKYIKKLVKMRDETGLFDLDSDISESKDLKAEKLDALKDMEKTYEQWNSQMAEPVWTRQRRQRKTKKKKT